MTGANWDGRENENVNFYYRSIFVSFLLDDNCVFVSGKFLRMCQEKGVASGVLFQSPR